jgi:hypothetical protein
MFLLALSAVFVATFSLCAGVYLYINRDQLAARQSARDRLRRMMDPGHDDAPSILHDWRARSTKPAWT